MLCAVPFNDILSSGVLKSIGIYPWSGVYFVLGSWEWDESNQIRIRLSVYQRISRTLPCHSTTSLKLYIQNRGAKFSQFSLSLSVVSLYVQSSQMHFQVISGDINRCVGAVNYSVRSNPSSPYRSLFFQFSSHINFN